MKQNIRMQFFRTFLSLVIITGSGIFFLAGNSLAETANADKWNISADKMTRYENPPRIIAEGNVILEKTRTTTQEVQSQGTWDTLLEEPADGGEEPETEIITKTDTLTTIKADWISYDVNQGTIKARGNLQISVGQDQLSASTGEVDLNNETGIFNDAVIIRQGNKIHLEGKVIEKTGDITYSIEDGWVITCLLKEDETPPWSFAAKNTDITEGGYAILSHATFKIKDIPILYSPWMIVPVKNTRQSGLLFPELSVSDRDGFGINLPVFINLSPSSDITLYPEILTDRGLNSGVEFRYVLSSESKGNFMANHLRDKLSEQGTQDNLDYRNDYNYLHTNEDRYWLRGKADNTFGDWIARLDIDIVSDGDYLREFTSGLTGFNESHNEFARIYGRGFETNSVDERQNTFRLLRTWEDMSLNIELLGINDVRRTKTDPTPLWKLPSANYSGLIPVGETLVNFEWVAEYINYWRSDGVGAHRFDIFPRLTAPIPLGDYLEATAGIGIRETYYNIQEYGDATWDGDSSENRLLYELATEIGTTLLGDFNIAGDTIDTFQHMFRPYVAYSFIPNKDQSNLPQLDSTDLIEETSLFTYGIDNFFKVSGDNFEKQYGYIKIFQGYDFRSEEDDTPLTPINIKLQYDPLASFIMNYKTEIDVYGDGFLTHSFEGAWTSERGDLVYATYQFDDLNNIESISLDARVNLPLNFTAAYGIERSLEDSKTVKEEVALVYNQPCWAIEAKYSKTTSEDKFLFVFSLANIGNPLNLDF